MSYRLRTLAMGVAAVMAGVELTGCGAGSNNLPDPTPTPVSSVCTASTCVKGQFVDEPVVGLNYSCENVQSVTDANGLFTCPDNSVAQFYLLSANGKVRVSLGGVRIKQVKSTNNFIVEKLIQITPRDLVEGGTNLNELTTDPAQPASLQVVNILGFLQLIADPQYVTALPASRIEITTRMREYLNVLTDNIDASQFASTASLNAALKPLQDKLKAELNITPPTSAQVIARFQAGLIALRAGIYESSPALLEGAQQATEATATPGMVGKVPQVTDGRRALESIVLLLDRNDKAISLGLEWLGTVFPSADSSQDVPRTVFALPFYQAPTNELQATSADIGFQANGQIKPNFQYRAVNNSGQNVGAISITQGRMEKGFLLGFESFYRNLFGISESDVVDSTKLGQWERKASSGTSQVDYSGGVTVTRLRNIDPFLDPTYWKTVDTIKATDVERRPVFPLHLRVSLRNNDNRTPNAAGCTADGCDAGSFGLTVLENGNIISDTNNDCSAVSSSLLDGLGNQEYRLGMVSTIFRENQSTYLSPMILVPRIPGWEKFYGLQLGLITSAGGGKVKIDFSNVLNHFVSIFDSESENSTAQARWVNYAKYYKSLQIKGTSMAAEIVTAQGVVNAIAVQSCYNPQPKP